MTTHGLVNHWSDLFQLHVLVCRDHKSGSSSFRVELRSFTARLREHAPRPSVPC